MQFTAYPIPPDAVVTGELADAFGIPSGSRVGDAFPNGIPVVIERHAGLND